MKLDGCHAIWSFVVVVMLKRAWWVSCYMELGGGCHCKWDLMVVMLNGN